MSFYEMKVNSKTLAMYVKERWDAAVRRGHGVSAQRPSLGTRL